MLDYSLKVIFSFIDLQKSKFKHRKYLYFRPLVKFLPFQYKIKRFFSDTSFTQRDSSDRPCLLVCLSVFEYLRSSLLFHFWSVSPLVRLEISRNPAH